MSAHLAAGGKSSCLEGSFSFVFQHLQISEERRAQGEVHLSVGGNDVGLLSTMFDDALTEEGEGGRAWRRIREHRLECVNEVFK